MINYLSHNYYCYYYFTLEANRFDCTNLTIKKTFYIIFSYFPEFIHIFRLHSLHSDISHNKKQDNSSYLIGQFQCIQQTFYGQQHEFLGSNKNKEILTLLMVGYCSDTYTIFISWYFSYTFLQLYYATRSHRFFPKSW